MMHPVRGKARKDDAGSGTGYDGAGVTHATDTHGGEWLTEVLDTEYARYEPDTDRIRTLLDERLVDGGGARGAGRVRIPVLGLRLAGIPAGIAAAAVCATVAVAVTATVTNNQPNTPPRAATNNGGLPAASGLPSGAGAPSQAGSPAPGTHSSVTGQGAQTATKPASPTGSPSASASASHQAAGGSVVSATSAVAPSSNAQWTEEDVYVTLPDPVTALQVIIRATPNAGYSQERDYSTHDLSVFDVSVNSDASGLIYTFTLKPGQTVQPGTFTFAAQYSHSSPHDTSGDTYSLSATTDPAHGSTSGSAQGGF